MGVYSLFVNFRLGTQYSDELFDVENSRWYFSKVNLNFFFLFLGFQSTTYLMENGLKTVSIGPNNTQITRIYTPTKRGCTIVSIQYFP